ncbi:MAG: hypothetical protein ABI837_12995 [Acidobacteriota bacterium]
MTEILIVDAERRSTGRGLTERLLVRAPTGDDGRLIAEILGSRGFEVVVLADVASLALEWNAGVGILLIASEVLPQNPCLPLFSSPVRGED